MMLLGVLACGNIIEIVPVSSPTPPAPAPTLNTPIPTASPGIPNRIIAKAIGLDAPVVEMGWRAVEREGQWVSEWDMPENEAAWHRNSALPGAGGNVVISGHNASTGGQVFAELDELQIGDEIEVQNDQNEVVSYQVVEKNIIRTFFGSEESLAYLRTVTEPTPEEQLTLISCWPRWSNTHRLIVIAVPQ